MQVTIKELLRHLKKAFSLVLCLKPYKGFLIPVGISIVLVDMFRALFKNICRTRSLAEACRSILRGLGPIVLMRILDDFWFIAPNVRDLMASNSLVSEPKTYSIVRNMVMKLSKNRGRVLFIDVGAHIGGYSVRIAKYVESLAIEPNPVALAYLKANTEINEVKVRIVPKALWNSKGRVNLIICGELGHSHVEEQTINPNPAKSISVEATTLDEIVKELRERYDVYVIKVDVEGAEVEVLEGSLETLKTGKAVLIIEIQPSNLHSVQEILHKLGYKIVHIEGLNYLAYKSHTPKSSYARALRR